MLIGAGGSLRKNFYVQVQIDILDVLEKSISVNVVPPNGVAYFNDDAFVWFTFGTYAYKVPSSLLYIDCAKLREQEPIDALQRDFLFLTPLEFTGNMRLCGKRALLVYTDGTTEMLFDEKLVKRFPVGAQLFVDRTDLTCPALVSLDGVDAIGCIMPMREKTSVR